MLTNDIQELNFYNYKGKNITMYVIKIISIVIAMIAEEDNLTFPRAMTKFYSSKTYQKLKNTNTLLWAESPGFIVYMYHEIG